MVFFTGWTPSFSHLTKETFFIEGGLLKSLPCTDISLNPLTKWNPEHQRGGGWKKSCKSCIQALHAWYCRSCPLKEKRRISELSLKARSDIIHWEVQMDHFRKLNQKLVYHKATFLIFIGCRMWRGNSGLVTTLEGTPGYLDRIHSRLNQPTLWSDDLLYFCCHSKTRTLWPLSVFKHQYRPLLVVLRPYFSAK